MEKVKNNLIIRILKVMITIFLIYVQLLMMFFLYKATHTISVYATLLFEIIKIILVLHIIYKQQIVEYKLIWITVITFMPIPGLLLYIFWGNKSISKNIKRRLAEIDENYSRYFKHNFKIYEELESSDLEKYKYANYVYNTTSYPLYRTDELKYFDTGEEYLEFMIADLKSAKESIFLEYFIIGEGIIWEKIFKILKEKAQSGVNVCIITDEIGSTPIKVRELKKKIEKTDIKFKIFNPVFPFHTSYINFRNHRKITVIDSKLAYTGGVNLKDEYANLVTRFGKWKDAGIRITGESVNSFTIMFLETWNYIDNKDRFYIKDYINEEENHGEGYILPYADGPGNDSHSAKYTYLNIINNAKKYVYIMTPYLIIDEKTINSLTLASKSGIDVRIIVPYIHDKKTVKILMPTFYKILMRSGVKIYKYKPGFIHSKVCLSDDEVASVGTVNFDYRSFYLHFECGVWLYKTKEELNIKKDFENTFKECEEITMQDFKRKNIFIRLLEAILKVFAPLL